MQKLHNILKNLFNGHHLKLEAYVIALVLIMATFPDVIFLGTSLRLTDQYVGFERGMSLRAFYPVMKHIGWHSGNNDAGGAVHQSEPMIQFMRHTIKNADSPYWNPYSAAGSLGPETLVDQKFSAFTLINAALGGGSHVHNAMMLLFYYFATFFLYRTIRERFKLSALASTGVAIFYLLNGYSIANIGSNVSQSYLYIPVCLYASLLFLEKATTLRFVGIIMSFSLLFSCTFIPTTFNSLLAIYTILIGCVFSRMNQHRLKSRSMLSGLFLQSGGVVLSLLLLAVLYFPILENIRGIGTLDDYAHRVFYPLRFYTAIPSFFSPSLFLESYQAMETRAVFWEFPYFAGNIVYHIGVVAIALAACAWPLKKYNSLAMTTALCLILVLCRMFEVPPFKELMSLIPIIGKFGCQYWWTAIMFSIAILLGYGINNLQQHNARISAATLLLTIGIIATLHRYKIYGLIEPHIQFKLFVIILMSILVIIIGILFILLRFRKNRLSNSNLVFSLVLMLFIELLADSKIIRLQKNESFLTPSETIAYVLKNIGLYRTLNFGATGLYSNLGSAFQIQEISSMNSGTLPHYKDYFYSAINLDTVIPFPTLMFIKDKSSSDKINWPLLNFLGVKYVLLPVGFVQYKNDLIQQGLRIAHETTTTFVFENPHVLPRAFSIGLPTYEESTAITLPMDFRQHIYPATITSYRNAKLEIQGSALRKMLVVISDNWHKNWSATLNGKKVPIVQVNGTFRGVVVQKGDYRITMEYRPRTLSLAISVSLGMVLLLGGMVFYRRSLDKFLT